MNFGEGKNEGIPWLTHCLMKARNLEGGNKKGIPWLTNWLMETISEKGTTKNTATHKLAHKDEFRRREQQR
jgi:hypothetical protein